MKTFYFILIAIVATSLLLLTSCEKEQDSLTTPTDRVVLKKDVKVEPGDPDYFVGEIPEATVQVLAPVKKKSRSITAISSLSPPVLDMSIQAGIPFVEDKDAFLSLPSIGDVMFHFDQSMSMSQEIGNVKNNAKNIFMAIETQIDNFQAGVSQGLTGFSLVKDLTPDIDEFNDGVDAVTLIGGTDEDYAEHFFRLGTMPSWRSEAAKVAVAFLDERPQAYSPYSMAQGLNAIDEAGIKLIVVFSGPSGSDYDAWVSLASSQGFELVRINTNGTIPSGMSISDFIIQTIKEAFCDLGVVECKVVQAEYQSWLNSVAPPSFNNVNICDQPDYGFRLTFLVPNCTEPGNYNFEVGLYGDNVPYATQEVKITVEPFPVAVDIHPGSCPNPLNTKSGGLTPVAILGMENFDVEKIDITTITLNGVPITKHSYEDVGTPEMPMLGKPLDHLACNEAGPDGFQDLTIKFVTSNLISTLGSPGKGDVYILDLRAVLLNGRCIYGEDVIVIAK